MEKPETSDDQAEDAIGPVGGEAAEAVPATGTEPSPEDRVSELEEERVELLSRLARAQADHSNLKRRAADEGEEVRRFANQIFAGEVLRVVDSLDRALGSIPESLAGFAWIDGLLILRAQMDAVLRAQGIAPIKAVGEKFDPQYHEAVSSGDTEPAGDEAVVLDEYQRGYVIHDRVLRPALVRAGSPETPPEDDGDAADAVDRPAEREPEVPAPGPAD